MIFVNNLFLNRRKFMAKNILICDDAAFMRMMIKDILMHPAPLRTEEDIPYHSQRIPLRKVPVTILWH